ncbi:hypothetical protein KSS87_021914 [Heliosperma pusillum]|nr:hypothetical protein KSS87_021914 [Heliosperma pusillum]
MLKKAVVVSTGVVSIAVILKQSLPITLEILTNELPYICSSFRHSWLQPPYLYLLINCIILSIVASSKLHPRVSDSPLPEKSAVAVFDEAVKNDVVFGYVADDLAPLTVNVTAEREEVMALPAVEAAENAEEKEKPRYSARFGNRKSIKGSPEGKTMLKKVSRPKRQETLESTWRTLTEGRPMPLARHLKKSDTFSGAQQELASPPVHIMKKLDTFSYGSSDPESPSPSTSPGSARKLRREPSLSQDELNRRVEAFIRKFNEEMRLQRQQESFNQYRSGHTK